MGNLLWSKKLIKVCSKANNNKYWNVYVYDDNSIKREWGRVSDSGRVQVDNFSNAEAEATKLLKKKLKDNYKELEILDSSSSTSSTKNIKEAALEQIAANKSAAVKTLVSELAESNIHNILSKTTLSYNQSSGLFSTPLGVVGKRSIKKATDILQKISIKINSNKLDDEWGELCEEYLTIIPHSVGVKLDLKNILGSNALLQNEYGILKSLEASIELMEDNKTGVKESLFDVEIELVEDAEIISYVENKFKRNLSAAHPSSRLKINRIFDLNIKSMTKEFQEVEEEIGNMRKLWHGTRAGNLLSILHKGMIIPQQNSTIVTGRMFGNGLYFSDVSTKALNYSYGTWNKVGLAKNGAYYALICNVLLGKQFIADKTHFQDSKYYPRKGYDSTFAKSGSLNLINNEMIVYQTQQVSPRYLVEFKS